MLRNSMLKTISGIASHEQTFWLVAVCHAWIEWKKIWRMPYTPLTSRRACVLRTIAPDKIGLKSTLKSVLIYFWRSNGCFINTMHELTRWHSYTCPNPVGSHRRNVMLYEMTSFRGQWRTHDSFLYTYTQCVKHGVDISVNNRFLKA